MKYFSIPFLVLLLAACGDDSGREAATVTNASDSIIFKDSGGNVITLADLENYTGTASYEITDDVAVNPEASRLHQEGRQLGAEGKYAEAVAKLKEAMIIQPEWAYPPYDLAYTYSLMGDDKNALKYYALTDSLKPEGFFTSKTALWSLQGERDGKFPAGTYTTYMMIEWASTDAEKLRIAKAIVDTLPDYAPAWMELAQLLDDQQERLAALETGLSKNPDAETKGILLINKAAVLESQGKHNEASAILGQLIFDPEATASNRKLAKTTLQSFF